MLKASNFNDVGAPFLPGLLGIDIQSVELDRVVAELPVREQLMAPNSFLHAGSVVTLADTCCGYGTVSNLSEDAQGFTTVELKSNFLGTAREGTLVCEARPVHRGKTTQVWDAEVRNKETGKVIALFRCTQMVLYKR